MGSEEMRSDQQASTVPAGGKLQTSTTTEESPVVKFDILLHNVDNDDDDEYQYQPGDRLRGDIILVVSSPLQVSSVAVELRGEASATWKAADKHTDRLRKASATTAANGGEACSRWYEASELYIDERNDILLDDVLQPGEHRFPMSFQLPAGLPTSFRGKFGGVSYVLRASFVDQTSMLASRSLVASRYVVNWPIVVRRPSSQDAQSQVHPVTVKLQRRLFASAPFICASGLLRVDFTVAGGTAYLLGDDIHVRVRLINDSPRVVVCLDVALVQQCEFRAQRARRRCVALVSRRRDTDARLTPVGYADTARCTNFRLGVPSDLPESRLDGCDIIEVSYELRFAVKVTGCRRRLKKRLPITISSTIIEEQPRQQRASRLEPDEPGSSTAISDVISKSRALSLSDEIITRFRRPITPGDTRQNIGFEAVLEEQEIDSSPVTERC